VKNFLQSTADKPHFILWTLIKLAHLSLCSNGYNFEFLYYVVLCPFFETWDHSGKMPLNSVQQKFILLVVWLPCQYIVF